MDKRGILKKGGLTLIIISVFIIIFLIKSSGASFKNSYEIGDFISIKLSEKEIAKIITPTETIIRNQKGDFLFELKEEGLFSIEILSNGKIKTSNFNVVKKGEKDPPHNINKEFPSANGKTNEPLTNNIKTKILSEIPDNKRININEEKISKNKREIKISSEEHIENISAQSSIEEKIKITERNRIKLYWVERNQYLDFNPIDENGDGYIDQIDWVIPHSSAQTFQIIIEITKAEHLDENKSFIADIYESVKSLDNFWSPQISENEYVRITFEKNLTSVNDITIYPRITEGSPKVEVYEIDSDIKIAEFTNIVSNEYNKIYLTNLISESQHSFDLRVVGGSLEFDHIIDPYNRIVRVFSSNTIWTVPAGVYEITVEAWGAGGAGGGASGGGDRAGGGGGGGAYAASNLSVSPGQNFTIIVAGLASGVAGAAGNPGGSSNVSNSTATYVRAAGGSGGGLSSNGAGGAGGTIANSIGTIRYAGGAGSAGSDASYGGAGGGGAGSTGTGGAASGSSAGNGTSELGGTGGAGLTGTGTGNPGFNHGGGGGGARKTGGPATVTGGSSAGGYVRISYDEFVPIIINVLSPRNQEYRTSTIWFNATANDNIVTWIVNYNGTNITLPSINSSLTVLDGTYNLLFYGIDSRGNVGLNNSISFSVNTQPPTVNIISPEQNKYYPTSQIYFNITTNQESIANYTLNNGVTNFSMTPNATATGFSALSNALTDANYTIRFYVWDIYGNLNSTVTRNFTIDTTHPLIEFTTPTENNDTYFRRNWIYANVSLAEQSFENITFTLYNSAMSQVNRTTYSSRFLNINWTLLSDGIYYYNVETYDKAGFYNITETRKITLDNQRPQLTIFSPQNKTYNISQLDFNYSVNETYLQSCWYSDDLGLTNYSLPGCQNITYSANENQNTLLIYANDSAGNIAQANISFFVDTIYPLIEFVSPTENNDTYFRRNWIFANVSLTEQNFENITFTLYDSVMSEINKTTYTERNLNINWTPLSDGIYYYNAQTCDIVNNCNSTETRKITLDTTGPVINIILPEPIIYNINTTLPLNFTVYDVGIGEVSICWWRLNDGDNQSITCGQNTTFDIVAEGNNRIYVFANDSLGNLNYEYVDFLVDSKIPSVSLNLPENNAFLNYTSIYFDYTSSDERGLDTCVLYGNFSGDWNEVEVESFAESSQEDVNIIRGYYEASSTENIIDIDLGESLVMNQTYFLAWASSPNGNPSQFTFTAELINSGDGATNTLRFQRVATNMVWNISYMVVSASNVFVQHGSSTIATGSTTNTSTIASAVNLSKSWVILHTGCSSGSCTSNSYMNQIYTRGNLTNTNTVSFVREASANLGTRTTYQVVEFTDDTRVQNVPITMSSGTSATATISYVDTSKSFVYHTYSASSSGMAYSTNYVNLNSETQVGLTRVSSSTETINAEVFVIEFSNSSNARVQSKTKSLASTNFYDSDTINSAIDMDRAYIVYSQYGSAGAGTGTAYPRPFWVVNLSSQTLIEWWRGYNGQATTIRWYAVEHPTQENQIKLVEGNFSADLTSYGDGVYIWNVWCNNTIGSSSFAIANRTFTIDTTPPLIEFTSPTENNDTRFSRNWIFANVSVIETNERNITFALYNQTNLVSQTTSTTKQREINWTPLSDGEYYYNVTVYDSASHFNNTETRKITLDSTPPKITINSPLNKTYLANEFPLTINISLDEIGHSAFYTIDDWQSNTTLQTTDNINYYATQNLLPDGMYTIRFFANDTLNNINMTHSLTFSIDTTSPEVIVVSPEQNKYYNDSLILFEIETNEPSIANYSLDNGLTNFTLTPNATGTGFTSSQILIDNYYSVIFYVQDINGNPNSTQSRNFTVDTINPSIFFTENTPQNNLITKNTTITINVSATDTNLDEVILEWDGANESFSDNSSNFFWKQKILAEGTYVYKAYATDLASNTDSTETRTLNIDLTPPQFSQQNQTTNNLYTDRFYAEQEINLSAIWSDNFQLNSSWLSTDETGSWQNKTTYDSPQTLTGASSVSSFIWQNNSLDVGSLVSWRVYANDSAGWENSTEQMSFRVWGYSEVQESFFSPKGVRIGFNSTIYCKVTNNFTKSAISDYNVSFYEEGTYLGSSLTDEEGYAELLITGNNIAGTRGNNM
jgi:hypothetical protein